mmetsp:Transcript_38355/g.65812  ORF Transcript_38355/g.65812 Transcript_38355/m.65812 type:complete len:219 (-) Transcript_38355:331-987(-)
MSIFALPMKSSDSPATPLISRGSPSSDVIRVELHAGCHHPHMLVRFLTPLTLARFHIVVATLHCTRCHVLFAGPLWPFVFLTALAFVSIHIIVATLHCTRCHVLFGGPLWPFAFLIALFRRHRRCHHALAHNMHPATFRAIQIGGGRLPVALLYFLIALHQRAFLIVHLTLPCGAGLRRALLRFLADDLSDTPTFRVLLCAVVALVTDLHLNAKLVWH